MISQLNRLRRSTISGYRLGRIEFPTATNWKRGVGPLEDQAVLGQPVEEGRRGHRVALETQVVGTQGIDDEDDEEQQDEGERIISSRVDPQQE